MGTVTISVRVYTGGEHAGTDAVAPRFVRGRSLRSPIILLPRPLSTYSRNRPRRAAQAPPKPAPCHGDQSQGGQRVQVDPDGHLVALLQLRFGTRWISRLSSHGPPSRARASCSSNPSHDPRRVIYGAAPTPRGLGTW